MSRLDKILDRMPGWPDARGWIGFGVYFMCLLIFKMVYDKPALLDNEFFKTVATLIIGTGFVNGAVSWAYSATQGGGELANKNADLVKKQVESTPPISDAKEPTE